MFIGETETTLAYIPVLLCVVKTHEEQDELSVCAWQQNDHHVNWSVARTKGLKSIQFRKRVLEGLMIRKERKNQLQHGLRSAAGHNKEAFTGLYLPYLLFLHYTD